MGNRPLKYTDPDGREPAPYGPFVMPMEKYIITETYEGHQERPIPPGGVDYIGFAGKGAKDPILSTHTGKIEYEDSGDTGYGFYAILTHERDGTSYQEIFGHLARPSDAVHLVKDGKRYASKGDVLGIIGNTGNCWTMAGGKHASAPVTSAERAEGWGKHLHHEKEIMVNGAKAYVDQWQLENAVSNWLV